MLQSTLISATMRLLVAIGAVAAAAPALSATYFDCPVGDGSGDNLNRGFYIENFPGNRLDTVTLTYTPNGAGEYEIRLVARDRAYDGRIIGKPETVTFTADAETEETSQTFDFNGAPVSPGATITFSQEVVSQPGGASIFYDRGSCGFECPMLCPGVTQTDGTDAPLDDFRRSTVGVTVTGTYRVDAAAEGSWVNPSTLGEGMLFDYDPNVDGLFAAWFTFTLDAVEPMDPPPMDIGAPGQRWMTTLLSIDGNIADGALTANQGGAFDSPPTASETDPEVGQMTIDFTACDRAHVDYTIDTAGVSGGFDIEPLSKLINRDAFRCGQPAPLLFQQTVTVRQTFCADLESGTTQTGTCSNGGDLWFEAETATDRFMTPRNGATIARIGPEAPGFVGCQRASLSGDRLPLGDLSPGDFLCVRTDLGKLAEVELTDVPMDAGDVIFDLRLWAP